MKHLAVFAVIPFLSVGVNRCKSYANDTAKCNPYNIFRDNVFTTHRVNICDHDYTLVSYGEGEENEAERVVEAIAEVDKFTNIKSLDTDGANYFKYYVQRSVMMWGSVHYDLTFYDTGYVSVHTYKYEKDKSDKEKSVKVDIDKYYKFDAEKALKIYMTVFEIVDNHLKEEQDKEDEVERANDFLESITFDNVMDDLLSKEPLIFEYKHFSVIDTYFANITDDGTIADILRNASYAPYGKYEAAMTYRDIASISSQVTDQENNVVFSYSINLYENDRIVSIDVNLKDKYDRYYSKEMNYRVSREVMNGIFDKLIEIYEANHPSGNSGNSIDR